MKIEIFLIIIVLNIIIFGCSTLPKEKGEYLESNDISIFLNNFELIQETIKINKALNNDWKEYHSEFYGLYGLFGWYFYHNNNRKYYEADFISEFKTEFTRKINLEAPEELKIIFNNIGWDVDGSKKYWTIYFGFMLLEDKIKKEENYNGYKEEFNKLNLALKIVTLFMEKKVNYKNEYNKSVKILKLIDKYDLQLIEEHFLDLKTLKINGRSP